MLLTYARDNWFKETMDCLKDEDVYILDIVEMLHYSVSLWTHLAIVERRMDDPDLVILTAPDQLKHAKEKYIDPMVQTIAAGRQTLEDEVKSKNDLVNREAVNHKMSQLDLLQEQINLAIKSVPGI